MTCFAKIIVGCLITVSVAYVNDRHDSNAPVSPGRHRSRTFEMATDEETELSLTALFLFTLLMFIVLLVAPFAGAVILFFGLGAFNDNSEGDVRRTLRIDQSELMIGLTMVNEAWKMFEINGAQCRKRFICEVHVMEPELGSTARKIIQLADYINNIGESILPDPMQFLFKDYLETMRASKDKKDCSIYNRCSHSFANQVRYMRRSNDKASGRKSDSLKALGDIALVNLLVAGILVAPALATIPFASQLWVPGGILTLSMASSRALGGTTLADVNESTLAARLAFIHEAWQAFGINEVQCRKRFICEVHAKEPEMGLAGRKLIEIVEFVTSNLNNSKIPETIRPLFQDYLEPIRIGKERKECTEFNNCPHSFIDQMKFV